LTLIRKLLKFLTVREVPSFHSLSHLQHFLVRDEKKIRLLSKKRLTGCINRSIIRKAKTMTVEKDYGYAEKDNDFIEGDVFVVAMYRFLLELGSNIHKLPSLYENWSKDIVRRV
jgi:hypothetical protein